METQLESVYTYKYIKEKYQGYMSVCESHLSMKADRKEGYKNMYAL